MRCNNGELTYGPAVSAGHHFRRSMRTGYSSRLPVYPASQLPVKPTILEERKKSGSSASRCWLASVLGENHDEDSPPHHPCRLYASISSGVSLRCRASSLTHSHRNLAWEGFPQERTRARTGRNLKKADRISGIIARPATGLGSDRS